jgi:hypothetical protein
VASHRPMARSSASGSTQASTRHTVASPGSRQAPVNGSRRTPARPVRTGSRQRSTRRSRPGTWRWLAPRPLPRPELRPACADGRIAFWAIWRGGRVDCGTGWVAARRPRPARSAAAGMGMTGSQTRRSGLVMGFDTHMIAGHTEISTNPDSSRSIQAELRGPYLPPRDRRSPVPVCLLMASGPGPGGNPGPPALGASTAYWRDRRFTNCRCRTPESRLI